jgi:hypothetical protein
MTDNPDAPETLAELAVTMRYEASDRAGVPIGSPRSAGKVGVAATSLRALRAAYGERTQPEAPLRWCQVRPDAWGKAMWAVPSHKATPTLPALRAYAAPSTASRRPAARPRLERRS